MRLYKPATKVGVVGDIQIAIFIVVKNPAIAAGHLGVLGYQDVEDRFTFQHENGQLALTCSYTNNLLNGDYKSWFDSGIRSNEGAYLNDKKEGIWTFWYGDGTKMSTHTYVNGKWHGPATTCYKNGVKESEESYVNGNKTAPGPTGIATENCFNNWESCVTDLLAISGSCKVRLGLAPESNYS